MTFVGDPRFKAKGWFDPTLTPSGWFDESLADAPASNPDRTGTVTGSTTSSGTITGSTGRLGVVAGSTTSNGTVVGREGEPGTVTGSTTLNGTLAGTKATTGAVTDSTTSTGSIVGVKYDPSGPTSTTPTGSIRRREWYRYPQIIDEPTALQEAPGAVDGTSLSAGTIAGRRGSGSRTASITTTSAVLRGGKATRGYGTSWARAEVRGRIHGEGVTQVSTRVLRIHRDDEELVTIT